MQLLTYCPPYRRLQKSPSHYILTHTVAAAVFRETLNNFDIRCGSLPKAEVILDSEFLICEGGLRLSTVVSSCISC